MQIDTIVCGPLDVNCYIARADGKQKCTVVDPAAAEPVLAELERLGLQCTHILLTHGHFDHMAGAAALKRATGALICIHEADAYMLENEQACLASLANFHVETCSADLLLHDGETLDTGTLRFKVLHTPGHTPGGACFLNGDILFSGDTLFRLSVGRSDFPGSDPDALYHSIADTLFSLPGNVMVYPGHMGPTMLDSERAHNPFIKQYRGHQW